MQGQEAKRNETGVSEYRSIRGDERSEGPVRRMKRELAKSNHVHMQLMQEWKQSKAERKPGDVTNVTKIRLIFCAWTRC